MNKKQKILITVIIIVVLLIVVSSLFFYQKNDQDQEVTENAIEVVETIDNYEYRLEERDREIYKKYFLELKKVLETEPIDQEAYAKYVALLFVIDLYTLDNKISKYDIGSLEFVYHEDQEKFKNKLMDSLYKLVEDNTNRNRKQSLPIVKDATIQSIQETTYNKGSIPLPGYLIKVHISYEQDLGYDENVEITTVYEKNKMYVVSLQNSEEE